MYRILDNAHNVDKHEARWNEGIWLGVKPCTEEDFIRTEQGVVKASAVKRLSEACRWDAKVVRSNMGYPWRSVPNTNNDQIPVAIRSDGSTVTQDEEDSRIAADMLEHRRPEEQPRTERGPEINPREMKGQRRACASLWVF